MNRFDGQLNKPGFILVVAYLADEPVGQAWGFPDWPTNVEASRTEPMRPKSALTHRVFALCELMVRRAWAGRGIAHALHDEILSIRTEQEAELYVRPENTRAYRAYLRWGWCKVGETRPDLPGAPLFHVLNLPLPVRG
jgi:GNAT superfamily N-acetyltransferase